ncbi:hydantoinase/carbamoylase family amidase [Rubrobacter marinus]|uniref:Hydantoinase/carbamoylase family amidase n=1 Tax=Rubrobacter marinus TaxID=2653852 RepID=A0A6G8PWB9_9ACTN|nr:hydantoinase/carbamoylase family amidase [Rubrobacter marinus]
MDPPRLRPGGAGGSRAVRALGRGPGAPRADGRHRQHLRRASGRGARPARRLSLGHRAAGRSLRRCGRDSGGARGGAAVERLRGLSSPFGVVVFSGEEGARFGAPCIGSRVATGAFTAATLRELTDGEGRSVSECASSVGLRPEDSAEAAWEPGSVAAFLELHIEQGRVLENRGRPLGVVDAIAGSTRVELEFSGRPDHSGATPMPMRHDALAGASEFVLEAERRALALRTTVATVGRMEVDPGSVTTVPGTARLALDVRDVDSERQRDLAEELLDRATRIASRRGLELSATLLSDQSPVVLHKPIRERLARAAEVSGTDFCVLPSGASHDTAHVAKVAPSGMVFVPSHEGISHSPREWSDVEHIARAAGVLATALTSLDARKRD